MQSFLGCKQLHKLEIKRPIFQRLKLNPQLRFISSGGEEPTESDSESGGKGRGRGRGRKKKKKVNKSKNGETDGTGEGEEGSVTGGKK